MTSGNLPLLDNSDEDTKDTFQTGQVHVTEMQDNQKRTVRDSTESPNKDKMTHIQNITIFLRLRKASLIDH